jgi:nucleotide-binding universal stress UspA family protein
MSEFAPKKILCAVDMSPASGEVLRWAGLIARAFGSQVEVLHADWSEAPRYFTEGQVEDLAAETEARHRRVRSDLQKLADKTLGSDVSHAVSVEEGHAVEVILQRIRRNPPDLMIMGSHGHSAVARFLLGSVAENVVREAHCPTLVVKAAAERAKPSQPHAVLCPVKPGESAQGRVKLSTALASALGAELHLVQAMEEGAARDPVAPPLCDSAKEMAGHCHVTEIVLHGAAAEQIILHARKHSVDLVVLGAEHRSFLEFTTLGRTTERVLRHGPSSVLIVPSEG